MPRGALWDDSRTLYLANCRPAPNGRSWVMKDRCRDSESSVDDLRTGRGVVLGRAVATLRSVETHPLAWRIRLVGKTRLLYFFIFFLRVVVVETRDFSKSRRAW